MGLPRANRAREEPFPHGERRAVRAARELVGTYYGAAAVAGSDLEIAVANCATTVRLAGLSEPVALSRSVEVAHVVDAASPEPLLVQTRTMTRKLIAAEALGDALRSSIGAHDEPADREHGQPPSATSR